MGFKIQFKSIEDKIKDPKILFYIKHAPAEDRQTHLNKMLIRAIRRGDLEGIKKAVELGADVNAKDEFSGKYAIELAFLEADLHTVAYLKEKNANGDFSEIGLTITIDKNGLVNIEANGEYITKHIYPYFRMKEELERLNKNIDDMDF